MSLMAVAFELSLDAPCSKTKASVVFLEFPSHLTDSLALCIDSGWLSRLFSLSSFE